MHTPGPWKVQWHGGVGPNENTAVCKPDGMNKHEREANGRLIAAAPELLAALRVARAKLGISDDFCPLGCLDVVKQIDAAIAKAEGK